MATGTSAVKSIVRRHEDGRVLKRTRAGCRLDVRGQVSLIDAVTQLS